MKSLGFYRGTILASVLLIILAPAAPQGWTQTRRAVAPQPVADVAARNRVTISKIEGIGRAARVKTPVYNVSINEYSPAARDWARVLVQFETAAEWIDELEFRYFVQVQHPRSKTECRFLGVFSYIDIPRGKQHYTSVFLQPTALERYGDIIGIAVEVYFKGELVGMASNPEGPQGWWRTATIREIKGVLLNRSQTPFAFIAYDAYVNEKPR